MHIYSHIIKTCTSPSLDNGTCTYIVKIHDNDTCTYNYTIMTHVHTQLHDSDKRTYNYTIMTYIRTYTVASYIMTHVLHYREIKCLRRWYEIQAVWMCFYMYALTGDNVVHIGDV